MKISLALSLAVICLAGNAQNAGPARVFQIGVFDGASSEFAHGTPKSPVQVDADGSNPAKEWYGSQPAFMAADRADRDVEPAPAPRAIRFTISDTPAAAYRLHVALLIESRSIPALRICIERKCGIFHLQSTLNARMGDSDDTFQSVHAPADVAFNFPGTYLHSGSNTMTFQVIGMSDPIVEDQDLTYDAIELERVSASDLPTQSSAEILPTVFYQGQPSSLKELVDVYVRSGEWIKPGSNLDLTIAGNHYRGVLRGNQDFGEEKFEFSVPDFPSGTVAKLQWGSGDRQFQKDQALEPRKKWTIFVVPHTHLDVGYSDYQSKVSAVQSRAVDEGMELADRHPGFSYSVDGSWTIDQFFRNRVPADQQRAIAAMRSGKLFVPAQYAVLLTGFPTAEALIRSLYPSAQFSRLYGTPFNYANSTDAPTYSWSYASILAAAGIRYFVAGPNGHLTRGPVLLQGRLNQKSPFWWVGPDGNKVMFWYSRHYWELGIFFGLPPLVAAGHETIPIFLKSYEHPSYRPNAVLLFGSQQENTDLFPQQAELAGQWNEKYAYPTLVYSGFYAAMEEIARQSGDSIPSFSGDGGPYWEDGIAADARHAALERRTERRAPSAEKLATLAGLVDHRVAANKADLDRMWTNIVLMDEHTWNSHDSVSDPGNEQSRRQSQTKDQYGKEASQIADAVARNSMANLADSISAGPGSLIVFNTLNWKRSRLVTFDLQKRRELVDLSTGQRVSVEVVSESENLRRVRFWAADIPAMGYKVFELRRTDRELVPVAVGHLPILENKYYRVELDPATGAVRSIFDKDLERELVNQQSPYRFGQYLYVAGGDQLPNTVRRYRSVLLQPELQINPARDGRLLSVTRTPYGSVARMQCTDTNTPAIQAEIRLFDQEKKIEFVEEVNKTATTRREAVYFSFPFAMDRPQFQYEIQTGVVDPAKDMYPGAGHEWFSVQHWISVQQNGYSATVMPMDASLVTLGDINRGAWPDHFGERSGTIFSYVMNNYWGTNYNASQGGRFRFRYVITSAQSTNAPALSRMGWGEATPLELNHVTRQDKAVNTPRPWNGSHGSYMTVDDPDLLVETWKTAEDGDGTILRCLDLGGETRSVTVRVPLLRLTKVVQTDAVEKDQHASALAGKDGFRFTVHPHEILTFRVVGDGDHP